MPSSDLLAFTDGTTNNDNDCGDIASIPPGLAIGIVAFVGVVVFLFAPPAQCLCVGQQNLARYSATGSSVVVKTIDLGD